MKRAVSNEYELEGYYQPNDLFTSTQNVSFDIQYVKPQKKNIGDYLSYITLFFLVAVCVALCAFYFFPPDLGQSSKIKSEIKVLQETIKGLSGSTENNKNMKIIQDKINTIEKSMQTIILNENHLTKKMAKTSSEMQDESDEMKMTFKNVTTDVSKMQNQLDEIWKEKGKIDLLEKSVESIEVRAKEVADELTERILEASTNITGELDNIRKNFKCLTTDIQEMQIKLDDISKEKNKINTIEKSIESITLNVNQVEDKLTKRVTEASNRMQGELNATNISFKILTTGFEKVQNKLKEISREEKKSVPRPIDSDTVNNFLNHYCDEYVMETTNTPLGVLCVDVIRNRN